MTTWQDERLKKIETLFSQGQKEESLELLKVFVVEEPDNLRALNDLGTILQSLGDVTGAEEVFRRAFSLSPNHQPTGVNLALCLGAVQKWGEARELVQKLLAVNQNEARLWALLARIEKGQGNITAAMDCLDRSLTLNPGQPDLSQVRASLAGKIEAGSAKPLPPVVLGYYKYLAEPPLELCAELEKKLVVTKVAAEHLGHLTWPLHSAEVIWLEGGMDLSAEVSLKPELLARKKVILRLFGLEIVDNIVANINYQTITDLIFTSHYLRDIFTSRFPQVSRRLRLHVIHPGLAPKAGSSASPHQKKQQRGGNKIAWIGRLDAPHEPLLMLQAFAFLHARHPELELHVVGLPDKSRHCLARPDFLKKNVEVQKATTFYGQVENLGSWLEDKDFILYTCPYENLGQGLLRALDMGLQPLVYDFPGAGSLLPSCGLWSNFDQLESRFNQQWDPAEGSGLVSEKYGLERQALNMLKAITGEEVVVEESPLNPQLPEEEQL